MTLKAIFLDFNGVIINDESIHKQLIDDLMVGENLRPEDSEFQELCLGRSDRVCIREILLRRGRVISDDYLSKLIQQKNQAYQQKIERLETLPIYSEIKDFLVLLQSKQLLIGLVSGALRSEIELVLDRIDISNYFDVIVAGDDIKTSKPEPDGYLLAVDRLRQQYPELELQASNCLVIEDTPAGMEAAKRAGIQVVGIANTYPLHMLQRQANWVVDSLSDVELERVEQILSAK